jgi:hypothetical protein
MDFDRTFGVEIEHGNREGYQYVASKVKAKFPRWDNTGQDGSGVEVRSPILKGQSGLDELGEVMLFLREIGGYLTKNDGMHVHHDACDFVPKGTSMGGRYDSSGALRLGVRQNKAHDAVMRVVESYAANQSIINKMVDPYRRRWQTITRDDLSSWKKSKAIATGNRNIHYSTEHGTFEFRQFEGCLDPTKAFAWIEFGQHFLNYTRDLRRPASCAATAKTLLERVGCSAYTQRALLDRPQRSQMPDRPPEGAPAPFYGDYAAVRLALGIREPYVEA